MTPARERIIEAALTLVAEEGLAGVTMVAVAKAAGVSRATVYNHYADVPSILADAALLHGHAAIDGVDRALSVVATASGAVEQLVRHVASISTHGHTLATHRSFPPELQEQLAGFDRELELRIGRVVADGVASGEFRPDLDVDVTATLLRHALTGVSELVAATPARAAEIVADASTTLLASLSADHHLDDPNR